MSPEANVKDEPKTAPAAEAKPAAKSRTEAENVLEGHAATIKGSHGVPLEKQKRDGRLSSFVGLILVALYVTIITKKYGAMDFMAAYHAVPWRIRIASLVAGMFLFGLTVPAPFYRFWMGYVATPMGWFMTRVILSIAFFLLVSPYGLVMRLFGGDPLRLGKRPGSYWVKREKRDPKHFEHMF